MEDNVYLGVISMEDEEKKIVLTFGGDAVVGSGDDVPLAFSYIKYIEAGDCHVRTFLVMTRSHQFEMTASGGYTTGTV